MKVPCGVFSLSGLDELRLSRCTRGWLIESGGQQSGIIGSRFAFDRIEDVADFLVTTLSPSTPPETPDAESPRAIGVGAGGKELP